MPPMRAGARDRDPSHTSPNVRKSANTAGESWDYRTTTQRPDSRSSDLVAVRVAFAASPLQAEATYEFSRSGLAAFRSRTQRNHPRPALSFDPRLLSPSLSPFD